MKAQSVEMAIEQAVTDIDRQGNEALVTMAKLNDATVRDLAMMLGEARAHEKAQSARISELLNEKNELLVDVAQLECDLRAERENALLMTADGSVAH